MKKLILIDGNAIVHRAFHALPPLTNLKGEMTNAVYGFFSMLLSVISSQKPDFFIVCFDRAKPTFRQALFVGYQQHRPKMSDDLVPQISLLHKVLQKLEVCIFEVDGYEADDLVGTIAKQSQKSSIRQAQDKSQIEVIVVSGDRDLLQLVNGNVKVLMPVVGISKSVLMGAAEVEEKYGIKPSQIVDYKAMVGDASDGYPGVSGIGPKTARDLLNKYGSFEKIYQSLKDIDPKLSLKLATDVEQAALAKKLATIDVNSPITLDFEKCKTPELRKVGKVLKSFGFRTLSERAFKFAAPQVQTKSSFAKASEDKEQLDLL